MPKPEPRPRACKARTGPIYVPGSAEPWKRQIRALVASQVASRGLQAPWAGPIAVRFCFVLAETRVPVWDRTPDWDNLAKAAQDALGTGKGTAARWAPVLWHDDRQVVDAIVSKRAGAVPGLRIEAWELAPHEVARLSVLGMQDPAARAESCQTT